MPSPTLIYFLAAIPIINSYIYSYYLYYQKRYKEFTTTIVNIPYFIVCSGIFYVLIKMLYDFEKIELLYIYSAVAATSILYTILSLYYPKIPAEINSYISLIPKNNIVS
jgi:hypothetical protein